MKAVYESRRARRDRETILASGTFDIAWYRWRYLADAPGIDPVGHYLARGSTLGFFPNTLFDTRWYLDAYADVRQARCNPLVHYNAYGFREARRPNRWFDVDWFLALHNGVPVNPLIACRAYSVV